MAFLLLDAAPALGGVVKTERIDGFVIDAGPDALLTHKSAAIELCRELGMGDRLRPQLQRGTFLVRRGTLRALPEASVFGIPVDWVSSKGEGRARPVPAAPWRTSTTRTGRTVAQFLKNHPS